MQFRTGIILLATTISVGSLDGSTETVCIESPPPAVDGESIFASRQRKYQSDIGCASPAKAAVCIAGFDIELRVPPGRRNHCDLSTCTIFQGGQLVENSVHCDRLGGLP
ncbi:unnamed protein product [Macrosiphum euphorbiae]|uniref:Uncharacterized protein n=1 Tax=Macrosiphum euphorbiae TaxID=13131 RepID=A0AAV0X9F6_9HEMI|nr:unnamed protein product [Macrosiphum euphorbiae]